MPGAALTAVLIQQVSVRAIMAALHLVRGEGYLSFELTEGVLILLCHKV